MRFLRAALPMLLILGATLGGTSLGAGPPCVDPNNPICDQHSVTADQAAGDFHGLIMVAGDESVLDIAANSGSQPGCGDCVWTLVIACEHDNPGNSHSQVPCNGAGGSQQCAKGQTLFRLFLSTDTEANHVVDTLCLGGPNDIVDVATTAASDVDRYLKDVVPPNLAIATQPPTDALTDVPTYFQLATPNVAPQTFGGPQVSETITIKPARYTWHWGDDTADLVTADPGGPYPDGQVTHTYAHAAHVVGTLTTEWSATYTISAGGRTFGPFTATGTVTKTQQFRLTVDRARSHLVSHG